MLIQVGYFLLQIGLCPFEFRHKVFRQYNVILLSYSEHIERHHCGMLRIFIVILIDIAAMPITLGQKGHL